MSDTMVGRHGVLSIPSRITRGRTMAERDTQPGKTLRGTWAHILAHKDEIPGMSEVEVRVLEPESASDTDPTIALLESWIAQAPTEQEAIQEAEEDLREF